MEWLTHYLQEFTYFGVATALLIAGLGLPVPEDIPLIFGGAMAGAGRINVWIHFAVSMVFILIGDTCLFFIGRRIGEGDKGWGKRFEKILTPARLAKVTAWFDKYGAWTVFFGRFVAGIRGAIFLSAGVAGFKYSRFVLLDALAALLSVPIWIWLGYKFGEHWETVLHVAGKWQRSILLGAVALVVLVFLVRRARAKKGIEERSSMAE